VGVVASLAALWLFNRKAQPVKAFLSSCLYLFFMLAGACWGLYPTLLPATTGADRDITLSRAISGPHTLAVGLVWWGFGMVLAIGYIVFVYSKFRGKVDLHALILSGFMDLSSVFHRPGDSQEQMNQIMHQFSTYFCVEAGSCHVIHAKYWHNSSKSGFSVTVPSVEFREGGVQNPSSQPEFQIRCLT
jgi:hypothetical protein